VCRLPSTSTQYGISTPTPDILFGLIWIYLSKTRPLRCPYSEKSPSNTPGTAFPFLTVEFRGDSPSNGGTFWECTNQCLGGAACCVNILEQLNGHVKVLVNTLRPRQKPEYMCPGKRIQITIRSRLKGFLLQGRESLVGFHNIVLNIIYWGIGKRLSDIQASLGRL
jgi:hypothetical protein